SNHIQMHFRILDGAGTVTTMFDWNGNPAFFHSIQDGLKTCELLFSIGSIKTIRISEMCECPFQLNTSRIHFLCYLQYFFYASQANSIHPGFNFQMDPRPFFLIQCSVFQLLKDLLSKYSEGNVVLNSLICPFRSGITKDKERCLNSGFP